MYFFLLCVSGITSAFTKQPESKEPIVEDRQSPTELEQPPEVGTESEKLSIEPTTEQLEQPLEVSEVVEKPSTEQNTEQSIESEPSIPNLEAEPTEASVDIVPVLDATETSPEENTAEAIIESLDKETPVKSEQLESSETDLLTEIKPEEPTPLQALAEELQENVLAPVSITIDSAPSPPSEPALISPPITRAPQAYVFPTLSSKFRCSESDLSTMSASSTTSANSLSPSSNLPRSSFLGGSTGRLNHRSPSMESLEGKRYTAPPLATKQRRESLVDSIERQRRLSSTQPKLKGLVIPNSASSATTNGTSANPENGPIPRMVPPANRGGPATNGGRSNRCVPGHRTCPVQRRAKGALHGGS